MPTDDLVQLFWRFDNVMSDRGVSTAAGIPTGPWGFNGFVSQTGGGPAEVFGDGVGTVFLTRHLGTHEMFVWFTFTQPMYFSSVSFRHWHNHNPGYPTHPKYAVQLQLDRGTGYVDVGEPLELSNRNSGHTSTIALGFELAAGSYKMRFHPRGLKAPHRDTSSEFFAIKQLELSGHVLPETHVVKAPQPVARPRPAEPAPGEIAAKIGDFVDLEVRGVLVTRLKVMESKYGGKCARTGAPFGQGATIGFKHRDALTAEEKAAIFGTKKVTHILVRLPDAEPPAPVTLAVPADAAPCHPDAGRLHPFRVFIADEAAVRTYLSLDGDPSSEWACGNVSRRAVAYSCGHLTRDDRPLDHRHDPAELALCARVSTEAAARLTNFLMGEGRGIFEPFFAAAVAGEPVPAELSADVVRAAFGGTLAPGLLIRVERMEHRGELWEAFYGSTLACSGGGPIDLEEPEEETEAREIERWAVFTDWFAAVPGLRDHSYVGIGHSDDDPGALKPRLVLALTAAGSLVGAINHEVQA